MLELLQYVWVHSLEHLRKYLRTVPSRALLKLPGHAVGHACILQGCCVFDLAGGGLDSNGARTASIGHESQLDAEQWSDLAICLTPVRSIDATRRDPAASSHPHRPLQ